MKIIIKNIDFCRKCLRCKHSSTSVNMDPVHRRGSQVRIHFVFACVGWVFEEMSDCLTVLESGVSRMLGGGGLGWG